MIRLEYKNRPFVLQRRYSDIGNTKIVSCIIFTDKDHRSKEAKYFYFGTKALLLKPYIAKVC